MCRACPRVAARQNTLRGSPITPAYVRERQDAQPGYQRLAHPGGEVDGAHPFVGVLGKAGGIRTTEAQDAANTFEGVGKIRRRLSGHGPERGSLSRKYEGIP